MLAELSLLANTVTDDYSWWAEMLAVSHVTLAWCISICLLILGVIGIFLPMLPGQLFVLAAAVSHWLMLKESSHIDTLSFVVLVTCMLISQALEMAGGALGNKWFGGTKWGTLGTFLGGIVGMFFMPLGILLGPLFGAIICETAFAKNSLKISGKSGIGSALGVAMGILTKGAITLFMIILFLVDVLGGY